MLQGSKQLLGGGGNFVHGFLESECICLGRFAVTADFSDELEGRRVDFTVPRLLGGRPQYLNAPAHLTPPIDLFKTLPG